MKKKIVTRRQMIDGLNIAIKALNYIQEKNYRAKALNLNLPLNGETMSIIAFDAMDEMRRIFKMSDMEFSQQFTK